MKALETEPPDPLRYRFGENCIAVFPELCPFRPECKCPDAGETPVQEDAPGA